MKETTLKLAVPEGVEVNIAGNTIAVKGKLGEVKREFPVDMLKIKKEDKKLIVSVLSDKKKEKALLGTYGGHVKNMMRGVSEGIKYKLKVVYSHFPMTVKAQGDTISVDNFLGEKFPRKTKILKDVKVEIKGQEVTVSGIDKEKVAQTAANLEQVTKIKGLDPRVFQDGIYLVEKDGKAI